MAYNTRRSDGLSNVGQRRTNPPIGNNFVSGGQLAQNKGGMQQQQRPGGFNQSQNGRPQQQQNQQRGPQQQGGNVQQRLQANKPPQGAQQQQQKPPQQQVQQQPQKPPQQVQQQPQKPPQQQVQQQQAQQQQPNQNPPMEQDNQDPNVEGSVDGEGKKKPFWAKNSIKISRKEKQRRRNLRLGKILQPKNAVMILNELVKSATYSVSEIPSVDNQYTATVAVENVNHTGHGRSKMEAKNQAAESALKYIIKNRQMSALKAEEVDGEGGNDQGMETDTPAEDSTATTLPWQHVASFALYKLLSSWGEDPNQTRGQLNSFGTDSVPATPTTNKPAKKMPDNAVTLNPLMLMNQMLPQAQFEEMPREGTPPNITFSFKCTVNGQSFTGSGNTKKNAKKLAAFAVCTKVLGIQYPADVYAGV